MGATFEETESVTTWGVEGDGGEGAIGVAVRDGGAIHHARDAFFATIGAEDWAGDCPGWRGGWFALLLGEGEGG